VTSAAARPFAHETSSPKRDSIGVFSAFQRARNVSAARTQSSAGNACSITSRRRRVSAGARPVDENATVRAPRRTTEAPKALV
jgi:hypothetical protein